MGENSKMTLYDKTTLKQAYNRFAAQRDKAEIDPWKFEERERFVGQVLRENRSTLLEIGAGTGRDSFYFEQKGLRVTCADLSEEMVKLCREKGLNAYCMDFSELTFAADSFDAVFALNCLLHVPKARLDSVLGQIAKVLRPGGLFFYGVYGGQDSEGVWEKDFYEPKRFFTMFQDDSIQEVVRSRFRVEDFHTVPMGEGAPHFQSLLLRK